MPVTAEVAAAAGARAREYKRQPSNQGFATPSVNTGRPRSLGLAAGMVPLAMGWGHRSPWVPPPVAKQAQRAGNGPPPGLLRVPRPSLCASTATVPKIQANQRFNAHPVLSHNPTMAVTPGIPPAGNHCSDVQQTRRSHPVLSHNPTMVVTPGIPPAGNQCSRVQHTRWSHGHISSIRGVLAPRCAPCLDMPMLACNTHTHQQSTVHDNYAKKSNVRHGRKSHQNKQRWVAMCGTMLL